MGILNLTPDSFSDGGLYISKEEALGHARMMAQEGVAIIDVGGESTRPGASLVSADEELERVIPVIEAIAAEVPIPISIDTCKAAVMREAANAGAGMINDVMALQDSEALRTAAETGLPVCLMHMQGKPRTMQQSPIYKDVLSEVSSFLAARVAACEKAGIAKQKILVDPGFGFGKTLEHNLMLLKNLDQLTNLDVPILVGISRKSMIGAMLNDRPVDKRLFGSLSAAVIAILQGASIVRTHDVGVTVDALKVIQAVRTV
jgi:dihydropteroate synthase